jgi:hypothetical protein
MNDQIKGKRKNSREESGERSKRYLFRYVFERSQGFKKKGKVFF